MAENIELMLQHIRPVTKYDDYMTKFSHSRLENFTNCNRSYMYKYVYKNYSFDGSIATEIGSICHRVLELKAGYKMRHEEVDYNKLLNILYKGDSDEGLIGIDDIKLKYCDEWEEFDQKSGLFYEEKIQLFINDVLPYEMEDKDWEVLAAEQEFEFVYLDKYIIGGFIDRIDCKRDNNGNIIALRVVDYKTSKKVFDESHNKTAQQMLIYGLACYIMYGILPEQYQYIFVLIDREQLAMTKGYLARGLKKLDGVFAKIEECENSGCYKPSPCPLCAYCSYSVTNPNANEFKNYCEYYSLWTPYNKTYAVNKEYSPEDDMEI